MNAVHAKKYMLNFDFTPLLCLNSRPNSCPNGVFFSQKFPQRFWDPHSHLFSKPKVSFPGINWPETDADHPSPSGDGVKKKWRCYSTSSIRLNGVEKDKFTTFLHSPCCMKELRVVYA